LESRSLHSTAHKGVVNPSKNTTAQVMCLMIMDGGK